MTPFISSMFSSMFGDMMKNAGLSSMSDIAKNGITSQGAADMLTSQINKGAQPMPMTPVQAQMAPIAQYNPQAFQVPEITLLDQIPNWNQMNFRKPQQ